MKQKAWSNINNKLERFIKKFYLNKIAKGTLLFSTSFISIFLILNVLNESFYLDSNTRTVIFIISIAGFSYLFYKWLLYPLLGYFNIKREWNYNEFARYIGKKHPNISDMLLNLLQLTDFNNSLVVANLNQKHKTFSKIDFNKSINWRKNIKYARVFVVLMAIFLLLFTLWPNMIINNTRKIVRFNTEFEKDMPFSFILKNDNLTVFRNEPITINLKLEGEFLPENVFITTKTRKVKMKYNAENQLFTYDYINNIDNLNFKFEAEDYYSKTYKINVVDRPDMSNMSVQLVYPRYINKKSEYLKNTGNLLIEEGTRVIWQVEAPYADSVNIYLKPKKKTLNLNKKEQYFIGEQSFRKNSQYEIFLSNQYGKNIGKNKYNVEIIKDKYPKIELNVFQDTTYYKFVALSGIINDDYGFTKLKLNYRNSEIDDKYKSIDIPIKKSMQQQSFFYTFSLDSTNIKLGSNINYNLQVFDNDQVNGAKSTKSPSYTFNLPDKKTVKENFSNKQEKIESQIQKSLRKAKELRHKLKNMENQIKSKKNITWQDQKQISNILEKRLKLENEIHKMNEMNKVYQHQEAIFNEHENEIVKKSEELQQLMEEVLDDETKKMYQELQKLLNENMNHDKVQDIFEKLNQKENTLEKEIEQSLEMFKKLKFEKELNENIKEINELKKEQQELLDKNKNKSIDHEELKEKQKKLNEKFDELEKKMKKMEEANKKRLRPSPMDKSIEENTQKIDKSMEESMDKIEQKKNKKQQTEQQKKTVDEMDKLSKKLQALKKSIEKEGISEDMDNLKAILDGLIKVSFEEEYLINAFYNVRSADPRYLSLSQRQLKLVNRSKIIRDSLFSLSKRVIQIRGFVNDKLEDIDYNFKQIEKNIKDRKTEYLNANQQKTMTAVNDLALLLENIYDQMKNAEASGSGGKKKGKKKKGGSPSLSELQKSLSRRIQEIKKRKMTGRKLSKSLAKSAAEQERLRRMLSDLKQKMKQNALNKKTGENKGKNNKTDKNNNETDKNKDKGKNNSNNNKQTTSKDSENYKKMEESIKKLEKMMEESEKDLVNKRINDKLINRQKNIITRLLEAEKAIKEQEYDNKRKAQTANQNYEYILPESFKKYLKKAKQKTELLNKGNTIKLNPYFRKETNKYFKRLNKSYF